MKALVKRIYKSVGLLAVVFVAVSCGRKVDERPILAVSVEPQRYILEQLVGDDYRVVTVVPSNADPESFEPSTSVRGDLENSKIYFTVGALPFEGNLGLALGNDVNIVSTTTGITPIYGTHGHAHTNFLGGDVDSTDFVDPHFWVSVRNMRHISRNMTRELQVLDPDNAAKYSERYLALDRRLDSLDRAFADRFAKGGRKAFIVWHPTLSYFARDYGLEQIAVSDDNKEVSIRQLRRILDTAKEHGVDLFFTQGYCNEQQVQTIKQGIGARHVDINLSAYDWEDQITKVVDELTGI